MRGLSVLHPTGAKQVQGCVLIRRTGANTARLLDVAVAVNESNFPCEGGTSDLTITRCCLEVEVRPN